MWNPQSGIHLNINPNLWNVELPKICHLSLGLGLGLGLRIKTV